MGDEQISSEVDRKDLEMVGKRLEDPPSSKDSLCKLLKQSLLLLSSISQSPDEKILAAMQPTVEALVRPNLLAHKDKDVKLLVTTCISEVMRIVAPDAPYNDEILRDVFELIVASFKGLNETSSPHFQRRVNILEAVATYKSCILMLDLDCDSLIQEMFQIFFSTLSEVPIYVLEHMKTIMCLLIMESEEISEQLLELILGSLLKEKTEVSRAGYVLARAVLKDCCKELMPYIEAFLDSSMSKEKPSKSMWRESYSDLMYEIYTCAPSLLVSSISKLTDELLTDELDVRLKAVKLLGRMFASQQGVTDAFVEIFVEYMKRFTDKAVEVRLAMIECAKQCLLANPSGPRCGEFLSALSDRLQDFDSEVRLHVVIAICEFAHANPESMLVNELKRVALRLRDTEVTIRQETQQRLMGLYKLFCSRKVENLPIDAKNFYWIPRELIRSSCDRDNKEFRAQGMELVTEQLFPLDFPLKEAVKCWIEFFGDFDENSKKALRYILHQKQRLQSEMRSFLALRQKLKDEVVQDIELKIAGFCKSMSNIFADPSLAESQLRKLTQLKDNKMFKDLDDLLDPDTSYTQSVTIKTALLNRLGEKHPLFEFLKVLATKCSYALFGKEHMHILLAELRELKRLEDQNLLRTSMGLLVEFTNHFPSLLDGVEEDIMVLLNEDNEFLKDAAVQVLAKFGGSMRGRIAEGSKSVDLLRDLCIDGSRKQAKYAVQALAVMSNDSGVTVLSGLYRKLLDLLESCIKLPTILQSLGCIAQYAVSVFEAHEEDLVNFLVRDLFRRDSVISDVGDGDEHPLSDVTTLKIYGLKTLVRSFLPCKDSQLVRVKGLFGILLKFLECGEIAEDIKTSETDKAHLRLAAAKGVLRLSKRYDTQISPQLFEATISCAKDRTGFVKRGFLSKVEKLLKDRLIPHRYACAFPMGISETDYDFLEEAKQHLHDFVVISRRQVRHVDPFVAGQSYPEHVLFYFIHALAQQADFQQTCEDCPSFEEVEPYLKQLSLFLWAFLDENKASLLKFEEKQGATESLSLLYSIFCAMKHSEDVVDASKTQSTRILCDTGIAILEKIFGVDPSELNELPNVPLPSVIYKSSDSVIEKEKIDRSYISNFRANNDYFSRLFLFSNAMRKEHVEDGLSNGEENYDERENKVTESPEKISGSIGQQIVVMKESEAISQKESKVSSESSEDDERSRAVGQINGNQMGSVDAEGLQEELSTQLTGDVGKGDAPLEKQYKVSGTMGRKKKASMKSSKGISEQSKLRFDKDKPLLNKGIPRLPKMVGNEEGLLPLEALGSGRKRVRISIKLPQSTVIDRVSNDVTVKSSSKKKNEKEDVRTSAKEMMAHEIKKSGVSPRKYAKTVKLESITGPKAVVDRKKQTFGAELLNRKVQVYWPLDKRFYEGTIRSYNPDKNLHDVLYDDGDKETLNLKKERWRLVDEDELGTVESPSPKKLSKGDSQSKLKRNSKREWHSEGKPAKNRPHKKSKSDTSSLSSKHTEGSSCASDATEDDGTLDRFPASAPGGRSLSNSWKCSGKGFNAKPNGHIGRPTAMLKGCENLDENVPLDEWKPIIKKLL
ncbi:hypothetical protein KP509_34G009800 [Ceratopteris richardii]|uniref:Tudor domain-containing protein n=1 Tax=Ceratopteris richardii TaxID=49495 RepID=A0A8T2QJB2_CERRI|nr:hypothetical protein KP509_34G009800 [Ceratopteris richardii]